MVAKIPIVQGGMGVGISLSGLASAVANEGGIGVISAAVIGMDEPDIITNFLEANKNALRKEIQKAKEMTKGILGVNIMVALTNFADMVTTAIEEKIDIIFSGAGLPLDLPKYLVENSKTKLVPIVSSARAVSVICKKWLQKYNYLPDAIVVEGPMAGGHLGFKSDQIDDPNYSLQSLLPEIIKETKYFAQKYKKSIPVIAGGGVYTGEDIYDILQQGADGVQMGTRFVATIECDASEKFKQSYVDCKKEDVVIIKSPVGMPGRALKNKFIEDVSQGIRKPFKCNYRCIKTCKLKESPYCITLALMNAKNGNLQDGFAFAGSNAYRANEIVSVKQLMDTLVKEYKDKSRVKSQVT